MPDRARKPQLFPVTLHAYISAGRACTLYVGGATGGEIATTGYTLTLGPKSRLPRVQVLSL